MPGPLIYLAGAGHLSLLVRLFDRVVVPRSVYDEVVIAGAGLMGAAEVAEATWLEVEDVVPDPGLAQSLDRGEAAAITLKQCTGLKTRPLNRDKHPFPCGGDDWALPEVVTWASQPGLSAMSWNDFSNMHGGFFPYHTGHREGRNIDGAFTGYANRDVAAAQRILDYLNTFGRQISKVLVTFAPGSAFAKHISNKKLRDGRCATAVIVPVGGHIVHFDVRIEPRQELPTGQVGACVP